MVPTECNLTPIILHLKQALEIKNLLHFESSSRKPLNNVELRKKVAHCIALLKVKECNWESALQKIFEDERNVYEVTVYVLSHKVPEICKQALRIIKKNTTKAKPLQYLTNKWRILSLRYAYYADIPTCQLVTDVFDLSKIIDIIKPRLEENLRSKQLEAFKWLVLLSTFKSISLSELVYFTMDHHYELVLMYIGTSTDRMKLESLERYMYSHLAAYIAQQPHKEESPTIYETCSFYRELLDLMFFRFSTSTFSIDQLVKYMCWRLLLVKTLAIEDFQETCFDLCYEDSLAPMKMILTLLMLLHHSDYAAYIAQTYSKFYEAWPISPHILRLRTYMKPSSMSFYVNEDIRHSPLSIVEIRSESELMKLLICISKSPVCTLRLYSVLMGFGPLSVAAFYIHPVLYVVDMLDMRGDNILKMVTSYLRYSPNLIGFNIKADLIHLQDRYSYSDLVSFLQPRLHELLEGNQPTFENINFVLGVNNINTLKRDSNFIGWRRRPLKQETLHAVASEMYACHVLYKKTKMKLRSKGGGRSTVAPKQTPMNREADQLQFYLPEYKQRHHKVVVDHCLTGVGKSITKEGGSVLFLEKGEEKKLRDPSLIFLTTRSVKDLEKTGNYYFRLSPYLDKNTKVEIVKKNDFMRKVIYNL